MRNRAVLATLAFVGLTLTGALNYVGQPFTLPFAPARAEAVSKLVIPEATGFSGTLLGEVNHNDDGKVLDPKWQVFRIKVIKVVSYDGRNRVKLTPAALTAKWKDNFTPVGPANGAAPLPEFAEGDLVLVSGFQNEGHFRQTQTIAFKPGELELHCYTFLRKIESGPRISVALRKIGEEKTFTLAMEKNADGKMAPRADVLAAVDGLKEKTVVIVRLDHNVLKGIKPYEPPEKGEFVKFTTQKSGTKTVQAVELKDANGTTQTLPVSPDDTIELLRAARALKAGAEILYRTETNDQGTLLTDIHMPM